MQNQDFFFFFSNELNKAFSLPTGLLSATFYQPPALL